MIGCGGGTQQPLRLDALVHLFSLVVLPLTLRLRRTVMKALGAAMKLLVVLHIALGRVGRGVIDGGAWVTLYTIAKLKRLWVHS